MARTDDTGKQGCGCPGSEPDEKSGRPDNGSVPPRLGKRYVRVLETPSVTPRTHLHKVPEPLSEVVLNPPGSVPVRAVVPTRELNPELLRKLEGGLKDLPRLQIKEETGAVDIQLEGPDGSQVKTGTVVLEGPRGSVAIPMDAATRRFRTGDVAPGEYQVRATSSSSGRGFARLTVRVGDVTRAAVRLDGSAPKGTTDVRFALRGTGAATVKVRATDKASGRVVFNDTVAVRDGIVEIADIPYGRIHWDIDDGRARSCYDSDVDDLTVVIVPPLVHLAPIIDVLPDLPDWRFGGLPIEFRGVARILPELGVRSLEELAAAEPEDLMHRAQAIREKNSPPVHSRLFAHAIQTARAGLGVSRVMGEDRTDVRLGDGATFSRAFVPRAAGEAEFEVDVGPGRRADLLIQGPRGTERRSVTGSERVKLSAHAEDVIAGKGYQLSLTNTSGGTIAGVVRVLLPADRLIPGFAVGRPSVKEMIEAVYRALAVQNPGLGTSQPDTVMAPENIQMWLDRARTYMTAAGVCSMNDLGVFRLSPMPVLRTGVYVAPVVQPPNLALIPRLREYAF